MQPSVKIPVSVDAEFAPRKFALGCGFPLSQMVWGICIYTPTAKWNIHVGRYGTLPGTHRAASGRGA
jgi:hypothetical protein